MILAVVSPMFLRNRRFGDRLAISETVYPIHRTQESRREKPTRRVKLELSRRERKKSIIQSSQ